MISMTTWVEILSYNFQSTLSKNQLRETIIKECLFPKQMDKYGKYLVDDEAIWKKIIMQDPMCIETCKAMKFDSLDDVYSWYDEQRYLKKLQGLFY